MVKVIEIGEVIGEMDCQSCGAKVALRVSKKMNVFSVCGAIVERNGVPEKCLDRYTFGRSGGERLKAEYLEQEAINHGDKNRQNEKPAAGSAGTGVPAAAGNTGDGGAAGAKPGGILGAVTHFLTN